MAPRPVVLDTNFLLIPFRFRINIMAELDYLIEESHFYVVSSRTVAELEKLGSSVGKDGMAARLALKMLKASRIEMVKNEEHVDDWIVGYAKDNNAIVCTNDAALRRRLKRLNVKMIALRSRSRLGFV